MTLTARPSMHQGSERPGAPGHPIRVLHVINQLGPGGAERSLGDLVEPLSEHGVRVEIVCIYGVAPQYREGFLPDCPIRSLEARRLPAKALELRRALKADPVDVVHTTLFESNLVGRAAAAGLGVPVVTSLVNTEFEPVRRRDPRVHRGKLEVVRLLESWSGRLLTSRFHAITEAVKRSSVATLGLRAERIIVIPRGRSRATLGWPGRERREAARKGLGLSESAEVLINVGRHEFQKGHEHLLRAMGLLVEERPGLTLLIAGRRGNTSDDLTRLHTELGLGERVRFLGSRPDVGDLLAAADVFVFPSLYEGLGGAVIEAMALGLPVLASDLPALREVVEDGGNGRLVPPADPAALADAVSSLLDDPETRRRFGDRSLEIYERRFTIDRSAEALARLYGEVVA